MNWAMPEAVATIDVAHDTLLNVVGWYVAQSHWDMCVQDTEEILKEAKDDSKPS